MLRGALVPFRDHLYPQTMMLIHSSVTSTGHGRSPDGHHISTSLTLVLKAHSCFVVVQHQVCSQAGQWALPTIIIKPRYEAKLIWCCDHFQQVHHQRLPFTQIQCFSTSLKTGVQNDWVLTIEHSEEGESDVFCQTLFCQLPCLVAYSTELFEAELVCDLTDLFLD